MIDFSTPICDFDSKPIVNRELNGEAMLIILKKVLAEEPNAKETAQEILKGVEEPKPLLLKSVIVELLKTQFKDETPLTGAQKIQRGLLAERIFKAKRPIALDATQRSLLTKLVGLGCPTVIALRAIEIIDPESLITARRETGSDEE